MKVAQFSDDQIVAVLQDTFVGAWLANRQVSK